MSKAQDIFAKMSDTEKFGCKFALFPTWIEVYDLQKEDRIELMKLSTDRKRGEVKV